jgi:hypothetical protein
MMAIVYQPALTGSADIPFQLPLDKSWRADLNITPFRAGTLSRPGALAARSARG